MYADSGGAIAQANSSPVRSGKPKSRIAATTRNGTMTTATIRVTSRTRSEPALNG